MRYCVASARKGFMKKVHRRGGLGAKINRHLSEITINLLTPHIAQELLTNGVSRLF